jgi:hypothetical protein
MANKAIAFDPVGRPTRNSFAVCSRRIAGGSASFTSYEAQLELVLACGALGHVQLRGEARDVAGMGNKLLFGLEVDQTYVPAIIDSLQSALKRYPPRAV